MFNKRLHFSFTEDTVCTDYAVNDVDVLPYTHTKKNHDQNVEKQTSCIGVQTDIAFDDLKDYSTSDLQDKKQLRRNLYMECVLKDDESCKFYTGKLKIMFILTA